MITKALIALRPGASFTVLGERYDGITWLDNVQTKPTEQEVTDKVLELQQELEANAYQKQRAKEYPFIADQLDMLWHAIDNNALNKTSDFYTTIKAVKDAYPKSE